MPLHSSPAIVDLAAVRSAKLMGLPLERLPAFRPVALVGDNVDLIDGARGCVVGQYQQRRFAVAVRGLVRAVDADAIIRNATRIA